MEPDDRTGKPFKRLHIGIAGYDNDLYRNRNRWLLTDRDRNGNCNSTSEPCAFLYGRC